MVRPTAPRTRANIESNHRRHACVGGSSAVQKALKTCRLTVRKPAQVPFQGRMQPVIHLRSAVSLLGRFPALAGVDLDVDHGEIVLLQGPNGAGKTTLLKACSGLVPVTSGTAVVLGYDLTTDRRSVRARIGLLSHATGLYDDLTVEDNVRFW